MRTEYYDVTVVNKQYISLKSGIGKVLVQACWSNFISCLKGMSDLYAAEFWYMLSFIALQKELYPLGSGAKLT